MRPRSLRPCGLVAWLGAAALVAGCRPTRTLFIDSVPPGALVRLDETVIGRTPLEHRFEHYGERRVSLYAPGYRTHSERMRFAPPWHARFPWDLFTEVLLPLGIDDRVVVAPITLEPDDGLEAVPAATDFVRHAGEVRETARREAALRAASAGPKPAAPAAPASNGAPAQTTGSPDGGLGP